MQNWVTVHRTKLHEATLYVPLCTYHAYIARLYHYLLGVSKCIINPIHYNCDVTVNDRVFTRFVM